MPRSRLVLLFCIIAVWFSATAFPARAQTSNADRQSQLQQEVAELSAGEAAAQRALTEIRSQKDIIDARVAELDRELVTATSRVVDLEAELVSLEMVLREAQESLVKAQAQLSAAREEVRRSAANMYRSARRCATFDYLTVERPDDLVKGSHYLDRVNERQQSTMQTIEVLRDAVAAHRSEVSATVRKANAAAADAQRARDDIARMRAEVEPARAQAAAQAAAESQQVAELAARKQEAEEELRTVSAAIAAELQRAAAASSPSPASGSSGACDARPVSGTLTSGFGPRWGRLHTGIDLAAPTGTPIYACWGGRVLIAGWQGGYGNAVVIDHGGGRATLYAHQSSLAVSVGQIVSAGALIGYVGSTGNSTGPHLHFEVRIDGETMNPAPYL